MLIAIMSETFAENNEIKQKARVKSHLRFVIDHWWVNPIIDQQKVQYLITAFNKEDEDQEVETLINIENKLDKLYIK